MDVADYDKAEPGSSVGPFIMNPEGVARLFSIDKMNDGPFPEHYEPIESPIGTNPLHPDVVSSPVARIYNDDITNMGKADAFPVHRNNLLHYGTVSPLDQTCSAQRHRSTRSFYRNR